MKQVKRLLTLVLIFTSTISFAGSDVDLFNYIEFDFTTTSVSESGSGWPEPGFMRVTGDSGDADGYSRAVEGFMDDATSLKFRVYVPHEGRYTYYITHDGTLDISGDTTGTFRCLEDLGRMGKIRVDGDHFYTDDGNPFYFSGETMWHIFRDDRNSQANNRQWIDSCATQGITVLMVRLGEPNSSSHTLNSELPFAWDGSDYNLDQINYSWWDNLDSLLLYAFEEHDLALAIGLSFANNGSPLSTYNLTDQTQWFEYIDARYGALPVIWAGFWQFNDPSPSQTDLDEFWGIMSDSSTYDNPIGSHPQSQATNPILKANVDCFLNQYHSITTTQLFDNILTYADSSKVWGNIEFGYYCDDSGGCSCSEQDNDTNDETILDMSAAVIFGGGAILGNGNRNLWNSSCGSFSSSYLAVDYRYYVKYLHQFREDHPRHRQCDTHSRGGGDNYFHMHKDNVGHYVYFRTDPGATSFDFSDMTDTDGGRWLDLDNGSYSAYGNVGNGGSESINPSKANVIFILERAHPDAGSRIVITN